LPMLGAKVSAEARPSGRRADVGRPTDTAIRRRARL
jgi:hypothetical protein